MINGDVLGEADGLAVARHAERYGPWRTARLQATVDLVETLDWLRALPDRTP